MDLKTCFCVVLDCIFNSTIFNFPKLKFWKRFYSQKIHHILSLSNNLGKTTKNINKKTNQSQKLLWKFSFFFTVNKSSILCFFYIQISQEDIILIKKKWLNTFLVVTY